MILGRVNLHLSPTRLQHTRPRDLFYTCLSLVPLVSQAALGPLGRVSAPRLFHTCLHLSPCLSPFLLHLSPTCLGLLWIHIHGRMFSPAPRLDTLG